MRHQIIFSNLCCCLLAVDEVNYKELRVNKFKCLVMLCKFMLVLVYFVVISCQFIG